MQTIVDQIQGYAAYHRDWRNKLTHFAGVPLIIYALFVALGWFRFVSPELLPFPLTGGTLLLVGVSIYYMTLDRGLALLQLPFNLALLFLADRAAVAPFGRSAAIFGASFVGGWVIQLIGHAFEGRRPALVDNLMQVFNAPLFLLAELLFALGLRSKLREQVESGYAWSQSVPGRGAE